ncbi:hypothetical protein Bca4012_061533 [Brassica carinata]|uniref:F-box domain-containing protein n=1 Tax=Brassica carinata TaxID=52824 RepID=A0A8X7QEG5_BRACI|nr:hypothetical protein Bca52824_062573 [Brassica carinata]
MYKYAAAAKRRKKETSPSSSFDSLPDALAISCLARVSRLDQAALSLVSKRFRSLVVSPEFYKARSLMGHAEKCVYVCLGLPPYLIPRWFVLHPTLDPATGKTVKRAHPIPFFPSQPREGSAVVSLDWSIYVFGGLDNGGERTSGVLLLDCRYHTWHQVTPMRVARASATAQVVNGKIYVLGGCKDRKSADWGEVFDPKTQTWAALTVSEPMPDEEDPDTRPRMSLIHGSVVIEDKIYVIDLWNRTFFYSLSQCKWGRGSLARRDSRSKNRRDWCVIDNVLYSVGNDGCIYCCKPEELDRCAGLGMNWFELINWSMKSLQGKLTRSRVANFGGKMARVWEKTHNFTKCLEDILPGAKLTNSGQNGVVFWKELLPEKSVEIWCAEFSLTRDDEWGRMFGVLECSNPILTLDPILDRSKVLYSISVDV